MSRTTTTLAAVGTAVATAAAATLLAAAPAAAMPERVTKQIRIDITATTAPIRTDVPYTVTATPVSATAGRRVRVQVRGRVGWVGVDTLRLNRNGTARGTVEGYQPGVGRYRALLMGATRPIATSPVDTITYTAG